jgi:hypothetical protein
MSKEWKWTFSRVARDPRFKRCTGCKWRQYVARILLIVELISADGGRLLFLIVVQQAGDAFAPESLLLALRRASKRRRAGLPFLVNTLVAIN